MADRQRARLQNCTLVFVPGVLVLTTLRVILYFDFVDPATGFYDTGNALSLTFNLLALLFGVLLVLPAALERRVLDAPPARLGPGAGVCAFLLAAITMFRAFAHAFLLMQQRGAAPRRLPDQLFDVTLLVLSLGAGAVFLLLAIDLLSRAAWRYAAARTLAIPILYECFLLVERFTKSAASVAISDRLLELLFTVLGILFFAAHARVLTGLNRNVGYRLLAVCGYGCAAAGLVRLAPVLLGFCLGRVSVDLPYMATLLQEAALSLYCITFTYGALRGARPLPAGEAPK